MKTVSYYKAVPPQHGVTIMLFEGGPDFAWVTEATDDSDLLNAVRLAKRYGGVPWRDGDGISLNTRYGIIPNQ